ncbi:MAG TPA: CHC2 zinc finger domain-containing protein [Candidatus Cybelea sp.]|jgi:DNA primase
MSAYRRASSVVDRVTSSDVLCRAGIATVRRGSRTWFICPSHDDRHPSAIIVGERGWRCFACGARGGVLDLCIALGFARDRASAARFLEDLR